MGELAELIGKEHLSRSHKCGTKVEIAPVIWRKKDGQDAGDANTIKIGFKEVRRQREDTTKCARCNYVVPAHFDNLGEAIAGGSILPSEHDHRFISLPNVWCLSFSFPRKQTDVQHMQVQKNYYEDAHKRDQTFLSQMK